MRTIHIYTHITHTYLHTYIHTYIHEQYYSLRRPDNPWPKAAELLNVWRAQALAWLQPGKQSRQ